MKSAGTPVLVPGLLLFAISVAAVAQEHKIPDAPAEYLAMENPIKDEEVDEKFLRNIDKLYRRKCKKCHGAVGDGQGRAADDVSDPKPTALNAPGYLASRKDGQLFWITMYGSDGTEMEGYGPDSDVGLSEEKVWRLVSYMRAKFTK